MFFGGALREALDLVSCSPMAASMTERARILGSVGFLPGSFLDSGFELGLGISHHAIRNGDSH